MSHRLGFTREDALKRFIFVQEVGGVKDQEPTLAEGHAFRL
jgi:hypothetical protein